MARIDPASMSGPERDMLCLRLMGEGKTYDVIAKAVGYRSKGSVSKAIKRALSAVPAKDLTREELIDLELFKISLMEAPLWPRARRGDLSAVQMLNVLGQRKDRITGINVAPRQASPAPATAERSEDGVVVPMKRIEKLREQYAQIATGDG